MHQTVKRARLQKNKRTFKKTGTFGETPDLHGRVRAIDARMLVDLARRSCYVGLQLAVAKCIGTAARSKAAVMMRRSWQAGLQLEVAKRIHPNSRAKGSCQVILAIVLLLCYAGLQLDVAKRIVAAARKEEMGCRSYRRASWEAAQSMVREEVAQIKGCLTKKEVTESEEVAQSLSEEVTQEKNIHPFTHTSVHSFNH